MTRQQLRQAINQNRTDMEVEREIMAILGWPVHTINGTAVGWMTPWGDVLKVGQFTTNPKATVQLVAENLRAQYEGMTPKQILLDLI